LTENERVQRESALRRLQARGERLLQWFPELRKTWQREGEPSLETLVAQLQSLGGQVSRRAQETGRDLEARAEGVLADLERQAVRTLTPLLSRANLASSSDLTQVEHRLAEAEQRVGSLFEASERGASRTTALEQRMEESRTDTAERLREIDVRTS